jgi:hypothetical protein
VKLLPASSSISIDQDLALEKTPRRSISTVTEQTSIQQEGHSMYSFWKKRVAQGCRGMRARCYAVVVLALFMIFPNGASAAAQADGGILYREITARRDMITVKLLGVTEYALTEAFNDVLERAPGVVQARRYRFRLEPSRPADCIVEWSVRIQDTDPFQLQGHINEMLQEGVEKETIAAGTADKSRPGIGDLDRISNIRPWRASSRQIEFVLDRHRSAHPVCEGPFCHGSRYWEALPGAGFE